MKRFFTLSHVWTILVLLLAPALWQSCTKDARPDESSEFTFNQRYESRIPREWMEMSYETVKREGLFALDASRTYAYVAITLYESMAPGMANGRSLVGQLQGLNTLPRPEAGLAYDWGVVACHAAPEVLKAMIPTMSLTSQQHIEALTGAQEDRLERNLLIDYDVMLRSKAFGKTLAQAIITWANSDNRIGMEGLSYTHPSRVGNPQFWDPGTLNQSFMMPFWWTSRPFVIPTYRICEPPPPLPYSTDPSSQYYKEVKEVYDASFNPQLVQIGRYWANNPGQSGSPAGSWLGIANQLVDQYNLDITTTLRMYVLLTIGTRDAFIAVWYTKYKYNLQRPVTYIREVIGDATWNSPVPTPPYPDYLSGTSINAGASSEFLTRLFGFRPFGDSQHSDKGFGTRYFTSFKEAGIEAYNSRVYGGVHMRRACALGFESGECIADHIWNNLQFTR
jgi:hypothetical protein